VALVHRKNIVIVGAGIIGTCCAYFLQKEGHKVTVIDRNEPGTGASYGNAGSFSYYSAVGLNTPDIFLNIPYYLLSSYSPVSIKWNYIHKIFPWLVKFLKNCTAENMLKTAKAMNILLSESLDAYEEIFREIDVENLYEKKGVLYLWGKKNLKSMERSIEIRNQLGIDQEILNKSQIEEMEPNIQPIYEKGIFYKNAMHAKNPKKILEKIFDKFINLGGSFIQDDVELINNFELKGKNKDYDYDSLIIASGAFSKKFSDSCNENIPLETERGYHVHFKDCQKLISRPICFSDSGLYLTPMEQGLRAAGTVELGGLKNPSSKKRINYVIDQANSLLKNLPDPIDSWMGFRPTLPDFLPVIGKSKFKENIFYAFGHNHLGWTLGAITGKVIRDGVVERKSNFNLSPFLSNRF
jgi:glycine/D-amino acid oxidase-like deaminating enzyme